MFASSKVSINYYTQPTAVGRVNYVTARTPSGTSRTVIDSSGNVFIIQQFNTTTLYLTIIPADGSAALTRSITGATRNVLAATVNETASGGTGRTYISVGTIVVSANTYNEAIQILGSSGVASGTSGVFYGTSTSIYLNNIYGAYIDTTSNLEIYMGTVVSTGTKFIMSGTTNPTTTSIVPTTMRSIVAGTGTFGITRMIYDTANSYVLVVGSSTISSVTSSLLIVGSGTGYSTYKAIALGDTSAVSYLYSNVCKDKNSTAYVYAVGYRLDSISFGTDPIVGRFNVTGGTITNSWYKVIDTSGSLGGNGIFNAVASDSSGNVYCFGIINSTGNAGIVKFDNAGNILWARTFTSTSSITVREISVVGTTIYLVFTSGGSNTLTYSMPTDGTYSNTIINGVRVTVNPITVSTISVTLTATNPTFTSSTLTPTEYVTAVGRTNTGNNPTSTTIQTY